LVGFDDYHTPCMYELLVPAREGRLAAYDHGTTCKQIISPYMPLLACPMNYGVCKVDPPRIHDD
jgi:hypothetical protein